MPPTHFHEVDGDLFNHNIIGKFFGLSKILLGVSKSFEDDHNHKRFHELSACFMI